MAFWNRQKRQAPVAAPADAGEVQKSKKTANGFGGALIAWHSSVDGVHVQRLTASGIPHAG